MNAVPPTHNAVWSDAERIDIPVRAPSADQSVAASSRGIWLSNLRPMEARSAEWLPDVAARLNYLVLRLGTWFAPQPLRSMVALLSDPIFDGTPQPMIGPAEGGGIAAEFRTDQAELQIEFDVNGAATAYALMPGKVEWEGPLDQLPDGIEKWAWRLAQDSY